MPLVPKMGDTADSGLPAALRARLAKRGIIKDDEAAAEAPPEKKEKLAGKFAVVGSHRQDARIRLTRSIHAQATATSDGGISSRYFHWYNGCLMILESSEAPRGMASCG